MWFTKLCSFENYSWEEKAYFSCSHRWKWTSLYDLQTSDFKQFLIQASSWKSFSNVCSVFNTRVYSQSILWRIMFQACSTFLAHSAFFFVFFFGAESKFKITVTAKITFNKMSAYKVLQFSLSHGLGFHIWVWFIKEIFLKSVNHEFGF